MEKSLQKVFLALLCSLVGACAKNDGYESIFNGKDLSGWHNVLDSPETWLVADNTLVCTGTPTSILRSEQPYENFILKFEGHHLEKNSVGSLMIHSDALPAPGKPLPRGIIIDLFQNSQRKSIAAINGAKLERKNPMTKNSSSPLLTTPAKEWNEYQIESREGKITLQINGEIISEAVSSNLRKGYISFVSEGSEVSYRNIHIQELPTSNPGEEQTAALEEGFTSLYNGKDLSHWDHKPGHQGHWTAKDWTINYDGKSEEKDKSLWSKKEYGDFVLIADLLFTREPTQEMMPVVLPNGDNALHEDGSPKLMEVSYAGDTGIYLRGNSKSQVNMGNRPVGSGEIYGYRADKTLPAEVRSGAVPKINADNPPGEWNRFVITMIGDKVSVHLNEKLVIDDAVLPGIPTRGPIALQDDHADNNTFRFANLFIKELD